jgi:uncharacterized protein (DUF608 family)
VTRKCDCAGGVCGPYQDAETEIENGVTRRQFVTLLGMGTAGALLGTPASEAEAAERAAENEAVWRMQGGGAAAVKRVYRSATHTDARMPLGGIGTGNFEIGPDGQFTVWQLFNTLRDGYVPFFFGIKAGNTARVLQTAGGPPGAARVPNIEMTGEYPFATLRFLDPGLPVQAEMTAFSPFAPQDTRLSSMPLAAFVFRLTNPTKTKQVVSLAAFMQNPVGYDALGPIRSFNSVGFNSVSPRLSVSHPNYGVNVNAVAKTDRAAMLTMRSEPGPAPSLDRNVALYVHGTTDALNLFPVERPKSLTVASLDKLPEAAALTDAPHTVIWLEDAPADLPEPHLRAAREAVRAGAVLVFSGKSLPLFQAFADATKNGETPLVNTAPDVLFTDFENGYEGWKVEGDAFGTKPAGGTLPGQQQVSGFLGKGLVNTFLNGDDTTGRLTSQPFKIERNYIRFLVGGGNHRTTQIRLIVDGKVVHAAAGRNEERLLPARWDVRALRGQTAHIEIVDEQKGGWGHINIDHIEFSDLPFSRAVVEMLDEMLPARFAEEQPRSATAPPNLTPRDGGTESTTGSGLKLISRPFGKGRVIMTVSSLLAGGDASLIGARQRAYATLSELVGAKYTPSAGVPANAPGYGNLALATLGSGTTTALPAFDDWKTAWDTFVAKGSFAPLTTAAPNKPTPTGETVNGALAKTVDVPAGKTVEVVFLLAWHYPNKYSEAGALMGNHYTTLWPDAQALVKEAATNFPAIREKTERFRKTFYDSTLPYGLLDCVSSQISTIRHIGVVFRIGNGDIYGWEGSNGCCPPTCTHVWGYEQTLAYLFPDLEKDMRRIDFVHQQRPDGGVNNRTLVPSPPHPTGEQPFSDGHSSCILKAYREARNHPDATWLKTYWPRIKKGVEYLIARDAATSGGTPDGTLSDDQWNTYDNAIHGINTFIGSYYLAALRAGEEMAKRMGDKEAAERFHSVFEKGQANLVKLCWNGEYFYQNLPDYDKRAGEYGPGCLSDQLIGQWWAHQLGLGYILPKEHIHTALRSIYKYNWLTDHTNWRHNWRKFAGGKDKGLLICTWPKGGRPAETVPYVDEVWTGIEYQVAAHMIYEGMVDEGMTIVQGVRARYDGIPRAPIPRSPWNEIECGGHYARAMSSWSLLLALSGLEYDGPNGILRFTPRATPENYKAFFSAAEGWGSLRQTRKGTEQKVEMKVEQGKVAVRELHLSRNGSRTPSKVKVQVNGKAVRATLSPDLSEGNVRVLLDSRLSLASGSMLTVITD